MKKILSILLMACLVLSGCAGAKEPVKADETSSDNKELTKVVISEFRGIGWCSPYIADLLGYFEEEGLEAEYRVYKDGPIAFQGMHAGDSDFCLLSAEPVMRAYDEGMESYMILTHTNNRSYAFATQSDIKDIASLKGKTVFAGMPGSAPYSFFLSLLEKEGMSENDVNFINLDYGSAPLALGEGQIDGTFFDIYNKPAIEKAAPDANILVDCTDPETHEEMYGSQFCQTSIITCTKDFADKNPETVQKFTNACVKALKWVSEHTPEEMAELLAPMFEGMSKEELTGKFASLKSSFSETGEIVPDGYKTVEGFCLEQGLISKEIGFENIIPTQFVEKAIENLK